MRLPFRLVPLALLALLAACARPAPTPVPDEASLRTPPAGPVVGMEGLYGGHAWLGIPYAAPPVGELRWRAPRPAMAWSETRQTLASGARCPQLASALEGADNAGEPVGEEDCLTLSVYAPHFAADAVPQGDARLPVMLWIHGGGNTIGTGSFYDGSNLATTHDLVVVTLNYRLGPFGWFRHASLRGEGTSPEDRSGNFGTLDIIRSLHWVQENIAAFGGDPGNVTVFGESAGGRNTFTMLTSPLAKGLFHRAIVQSGGTGRNTVAEAENLVDATPPGQAASSGEIVRRLLAQQGAGADASPQAVAGLLRSQSPEALFALYRDDSREPGLGMLDMPRVFQEPTVLPADEYSAFASGEYNRVPVITGTNRDENKLFLYTDREYVRLSFGLIPRVQDPERYELVADYMSRAWKANAVDEIAPLLRKAQGPSVYAYRFDWDEEPKIFGSDLGQILGAAHAFEIPFVFGHFDLGRAGRVLFDDDNEPGRQALAGAMMSYWAQFAYSGDPGSGRDGKLPAWTAWDASRASADKYIVLDTPEGGGMRMANETVTAATIVAEIQADPRFEGSEDRCQLLEELAQWYERVERVASEQGAVRLACAAPEDAGAVGGE